MADRAGLAIVAAILLLAFGVGTYARFAGLGTWPVATDEFYMSQSVRHWDASGAPVYPRGGHYTRGLLVQVSMLGSAALLGHTELAYRLPIALFGLLAIVPLWLLAARHLGRVGAAVVVALYLLSSWHVEFARFARMYAPLTVVTLFFLYALERGFVDGNKRWKAAAAALVALCVMVHETHVILAGLFVAFALPQRGRGTASWRWAGLGFGILVLAYVWNRLFAVPDDLSFMLDPERGRPLLPINVPSLEALHTVWSSTGLTILWAGAVAACAFTAVRLRANPALVPVLIALAALLPLAAALLLLIAVFLGLVPRGMRTRSTAFTVGAGLAGSLACVGAAALWSGDLSLVARTLDWPLAYWQVVRPWLMAMPLWGSLCLLALGVGIARIVLTGYRPQRDALCAATAFALFTVALLRMGGVSTRYSYFLYPALVILLLEEGIRLLRLAPRLRPAQARPAAFAAAALLFGVSHDFNPRHLVDPASEEANFRTGRFERMYAHWYARFDWRQLAHEAEERLPVGATLLLTGRTLPVMRYYGDGPVRTFLWGRSGIARKTPDGWRDLWLDTPVCYGLEALAECLRKGAPLIAMQIEWQDHELIKSAPEIAGRWRFELAFTERSGRIGLFRIVPR